MLKLTIISAISTVLAGMGAGGGALFVILATTFLSYDQKEAQALNLFMFVTAGISSSIINFKNKEIEIKTFWKILPLMVAGAFVGIYFLNKITNEQLSMYFNIFMAIIGLYEIISSLKNMKAEKNNIKKERSVNDGMP